METKRYYSKVAGSKFIMPDGTELLFNHGFFDLKEEDYLGKYCQINAVQGHPADPRSGKPCYEVYKQEFENLIRIGNPLLYVQGKQPEALPRFNTESNAKSEAEVMAGEAALRGANAVVTGDVNSGQTGLTDVNASTVDPSLRDMVLQPDPMQDKVAQARAKAAANVAAATASAQRGSSSNS